MNRTAWWIAGAVVLVAVVALALLLPDTADATDAASAPTYDAAFWKQWGDGQAELAGYELTYPRYGELRRGSAVTVFVTETFAEGPRVKHESPTRPESETFPVIKLNLMQDFPTGIYDYNLMTSVFVALAESPSVPAGHASKISFSSQEWCGQVYAQLLFERDAIRFESHSYFDGEADELRELDRPNDALAEDALLLWARGLTAPVLEPGGSRRVKLLRSLERVRLAHVPPAWDTATLHRSDERERIEVPAGVFEVERLEVSVAESKTRPTYPVDAGTRPLPARTWAFFVETAPPRRLIRWERDDGLRADLLGETRAPYWSLNDRGLEGELERLGLRPRPPRTP